jgi:flagellar biosynthesis protein FlhF
VRRELGADALIGSTRHVNNGRTGAFGSSFVEITAAPGGAGPASHREPRARRVQRFSSEGGARARRMAPEEIERELDQLRAMLDELSATRKPKEKAQAMLHAAGFEGALAKDLAQGATRAARAGRDSLRVWLRNRIADRLLIQPNLIERPFRQVIACVGPTGVGKTTTLAKLAARAVYDLGKTVSVISLDTFRVGAFEQWQRYAELMGIPFGAVREPTNFTRFCAEHPTDIVLVDTAGRAAHDASGAAQLEACLGSVTDARAEVLLVLPAWVRATDAERVVASYERPKPTALVVTKLDETRQVGGALHAALPGPTPLAYLCDGPRVPEDLQNAAVPAVLDAVFPREG